MITITEHLLEQPWNLNQWFRWGFESVGMRNDDTKAALKAYREVVSAIRPHYGLAASADARLLTLGKDNKKFSKATSLQVGLSLSPSSNVINSKVARHATFKMASGTRVFDACPAAGDCIRGCVSMAGMGYLNSVNVGRQWKTALLIVAPNLFMWRLGCELGRLYRKHESGVVRLNTFSDIEWERVCPVIFQLMPNWQFVDYTKLAERASSATRPRFWPTNYSLAYSWNEKSDLEWVRNHLQQGGNVSVVASGVPELRLMELFNGGSRPMVVNADRSDEWILNLYHHGIVGVLKPKGHKIKPLIEKGSPFVITPVSINNIR